MRHHKEENDCVEQENIKWTPKSKNITIKCHISLLDRYLYLYSVLIIDIRVRNINRIVYKEQK